MRIARFNGGRIGVVQEGPDGETMVHDVTEVVRVDPGEWPPVGMNRVIAQFDDHRAAIEAALDAAPRSAARDVDFDTPIPWPRALVAIPVNYHDHAVEMSLPGGVEERRVLALGARPWPGTAARSCVPRGSPARCTTRRSWPSSSGAPAGA